MCAALAAGCATRGKTAAGAGLGEEGVAARNSTLAFSADRSFGKSLSGEDWKLLRKAELQALDYAAAGKAETWQGKTPGLSGSISASQPYLVGASSCRRFEHRLTEGNSNTRVAGTACKSGEGGWRLIS